MKINVLLIGVLRNNLIHERDCTVPENATVEDIVHHLQIPEQHIGTVLINGKHSQPGSCVSEGDSLTFIPIICGG